MPEIDGAKAVDFGRQPTDDFRFSGAALVLAHIPWPQIKLLLGFHAVGLALFAVTGTSNALLVDADAFVAVDAALSWQLYATCTLPATRQRLSAWIGDE